MKNCQVCKIPLKLETIFLYDEFALYKTVAISMEICPQCRAIYHTEEII